MTQARIAQTGYNVHTFAALRQVGPPPEGAYPHPQGATQGCCANARRWAASSRISTAIDKPEHKFYNNKVH